LVRPSALSVFVAASLALSACGGTTTASVSGARASSSTPKTSAAARNSKGCRLTPATLLSTRQLRGFVRNVDFSNVALPIHTGRGPVPPVVTAYKCGKFEGFITGVALKQPWRGQNDAKARKLHYPIGKWPYVPLTGAIVRRFPHHVLEIYEGVYQFTSIKEADAYLAIQSAAPPGAHSLGHPAGPHAFVFERRLGNDKRGDEQAIYVGTRVGHDVVTCSIQGGTRLTWKDVARYWRSAYADLNHTK